MLVYRKINPRVNLSIRLLQIINTSVEWLFCHQLNLVHVIEFPKCGGSWVRNMIRTYRKTSLFTYDRIIRRNEVILTHSLYSRRFKIPIIVVRDPRDMYVSFYYFQTSYKNRDENSPLFRYYKHDPNRPLKEDFYEYLKAKLLYPSHPWFSFREFLDSWLDRSNTCLIKYENCLVNPVGELLKMIKFIGDPIDYKKIEEAIDKTSFKAVTKEKYGKSRKPGEVDNTAFHRKGVAGDWKNHFNEEACYLFERYEGVSLRRLGYETNSSWIRAFLD